MKIIKNLFILGLVNFILMLGLLSADTVKNSMKLSEPIPIDLVATPTVSSNQIPTPSLSVTPKAETIIKTVKKTTSPTTIITPIPTVAVTTAPTPTIDPLAGKCIIYISGQRYDMTEFKNIHSGGDIFQCGTDMTDIFNGQHPASYLSRIAKYKI